MSLVQYPCYWQSKMAVKEAHFELWHMFSLTGTECVAQADGEEAMEHGASLAAGLAHTCTT